MSMSFVAKSLAGAALALAMGVATPGAAAEKYALGLFHFNIQYVAGGMVGFSNLPNPGSISTTT